MGEENFNMQQNTRSALDSEVPVKKKKHIGLIIFLVILALLIALAVKLLVDLKGMYVQAMEAYGRVQQIYSEITGDADAEKIETDAKEIQKVLKSVKAKLNGPIWKNFKAVPKYGKDYASALEVLDIADKLSDELVDPACKLLKEHSLKDVLRDAAKAKKIMSGGKLSKEELKEPFNKDAILAYLDAAEEYMPSIKNYYSQLKEIKFDIDSDNIYGSGIEKLGEYIQKYDDSEGYFVLIRLLFAN